MAFFLRPSLTITSEIAVTGRFLKLGARGIDKIENRLVATLRFAQRMAAHHNSRAAMPLALMFKGEFDLGSVREMPLGEKTDSLGGPLNLLVCKVDGIGKTNRNSLAFTKPRFAL